MRRGGSRAAWRSHLPGVFILLGLTAVSLTVFFLDTIRRELLEGPHIVVVAPEARGLVPGADVWVAGAPAGRVTAVSFGDPTGPEERRVVIRATIFNTAVPYLSRDTRAGISASALLAPVVLKLDPLGPARGPFDPADTLFVPPHETVERFLALAAEGRTVVDSLRGLSAALRHRLRDGPGTVASVQADTAFQGRLAAVSGKAKQIARAFTSDSDILRYLADDSVSAAFGRVSAGLRSLSADAHGVAVADSIQALAASLERVSERLEGMDEDLRAGRGTLGRALYDDEIKRQHALLRARLDSLRSDIREDPWRWVRLHLF